ncbi:MAG: ribosome maturation factor RimM [Longimicrobiaceae bacterium]
MASAAGDGFLIVGTVHKPHGIKGELSVRVETDHPDAVFRPGRALLLGDAKGAPTGGRLTVERARPFKGGLLLKAAEHATRDAAVDAMRGATLLIPAEEAAPLEENEAFIHQLVGMRVQADGETVGTVADVYEAPAGWYLGVSRPGRKELLVPFVGEMVRRIDPAERVVEVELPAGLLDL